MIPRNIDKMTPIKEIRCPVCEGSGQVLIDIGEDRLTAVGMCWKCMGTGKKERKP